MKRCLTLALTTLTAAIGASHGTTLVDTSIYPGLFGDAGELTVSTDIPEGSILDVYFGGTKEGALGDVWAAVAEGGAVSGSNILGVGEIRILESGAQVAIQNDALEFNISNPPDSLLGILGVGLAINLNWSATALFDEPGKELILKPDTTYRITFTTDADSELLDSAVEIAPTFGVELLDGEGTSVGYDGGGTVADILGLELVEVVGDPSGSGSATAEFTTGSSVPAGPAAVRFTGGAALPATVAGINTNFAKVSNLEVEEVVTDPYLLWIDETGISDPTDREKDADPDGDGKTNLDEFALNTNPEVSDGGGVTVAIGDPDGEGPEIAVCVMTIPVRTGAEFTGSGAALSASQDGADYQVEGSFELTNWTEAVSEVSPNDAFTNNLPVIEDGWEYRSFRVPGQTSDTPRAFLRVRTND